MTRIQTSGERPDGRRIVENVTERLIQKGRGLPPEKAREIAERTRKRLEHEHEGGRR